MSASEVAVTPSTPRLEAKVPLLEAGKSVVVKVDQDQIRQQDKTTSSTSPKWKTKSSSDHPAKDNSRTAASEAADVEIAAGQTASSENCYNHYARNLLLVHK